MVKTRCICSLKLALWHCQQGFSCRKSLSRSIQHTNFPRKTTQLKWVLQTDLQSWPLVCKLTIDRRQS